MIYAGCRPRTEAKNPATMRALLTEADRIQKQIIAILKEHEGGVSTADLCRKHGMSSASFYARKAKFGGMDVSDAKKLKALEDENGKLKKLLADAMLLAKMVNARRQARSGCSSEVGVRDEGTAGVPHHWQRQNHHPVQVLSAG